jgi:predicted RND superfamily exporter protein
MKIPVLADKLARAQAAHPVRCLAVGLIATVAAAIVASGLRFDSSFEALLPEDAPEVENTDDVRERTGGTRQLVVALGGADPQARLEFGRRLAARVEEVEHVRCVDREFPVDFFEDRALWLMEVATLDRLIPALEQAVHVAKVQANPLALHLDEEAEKQELEAAWKKVDDVIEAENAEPPVEAAAESEDGKYTFMLVVPTINFTDVDACRALLDAIRAEVAALDPAATGVHVRYAGNVKLVEEQHEIMRSDLRNASILALIFGVLVVAGFTRRPLAPVIVGAALIAGVVWTFALTRVIVGQVNIVTGFLIAVLIGLGIDFGIHLYVRYRQEREKRGAAGPEAVILAVTGTLPPALTSALTTAGTFFSFAITDFRGFSEFGLIAGIGVMLTLTSSFLIMPPILLLIERRAARRDTDAAPVLPSQAWISARFPLAAGFTLVFVAFAAFGATGLTSIPFRNNFKLLRGESDATAFLEYVDENLGRGFNPAVILARGVTETDRMKTIIEQTREGRESRIGEVVAAADFLPRDVAEHRPRIAKLHKILLDPKLDDAAAKEGDRAEQLRDARRMVQTEPWEFADLPEQIKRRFATLDGKEYLVYLWPEERTDADYQAVAWEDELHGLAAQFDEQGLKHQIADGTLIMAWIHRLIKADGVRLLLVAAAVVLVFLLIDFRRPLRTLLVFSPLVVGMMAFAGAIRAFGIELNMFNMVVLPSIIGIGIDNAVHIYHRYEVEGPGSVPLVIRNTGAAAMLASLTTAVGFGSALISHHMGLRTMGMVAVIGIGATFVAAVLFFPIGLTLIERLRSGGRPSRS